eukprot:5682212-Prymnesium_polylepis.1
MANVGLHAAHIRSGTIERACAKAARTSVASPSEVPVPCASTNFKRGKHPASSAAPIKRTCADPFGAVRLAERPSDRTAQLVRASAACSWPLSMRAPTPSPRAYPFARASNVLHRPSGESMPARA